MKDSEKRFLSKFVSNQEQVTEQIGRATDWANGQNLTQDDVGNLNIVLAEVLNNVVEHAYQYTENCPIEFELLVQDHVLEMKIRDIGKALQSVPIKKEMKGNDVPFEDLPEGGFGWFLIHTLCEEIHYKRVDSQNRLTLKMAVS